MEECDICLTRIKKRNKNKHEQSKKHKYYYSNLIIYKYIVKNNEIDKFKDIFKSHYDNHKNKINNFTVRVVCKIICKVIDEIKLPSGIVIKKTYGLFNKDVDSEIGIKPCFEYIDNYFFINSFYDEVNIIFISDFQDITFYHYMNQPKSMLAKKLIINLFKNQNGDYNHKWIPNFFVYNYIPTLT